MPIFAFTQIEVPWALGPPDGRYLVRAEGADREAAPTHVLVFATLGAPTRHRLSRRRRPAAAEPDPTPVTIGRATVIAAAEPFADAAAAARWLATAGEEALAEQLAVLERALHAFRVVTADPYVEPLARERLLVARLGFGAGEEVAHGRWSQARELLPPPASRKRSKVLEPQARLAGVLGGRVPLLVCEELALRARRDLDAGRERAAALQLRVAFEAALDELADDERLAARVGELRQRQPDVVTTAQVLRRELTERERETVSGGLARLEAALRARAASLQ
ncbi:MAG TPA: hypothetical protein VMV16_01005 [Solirubrobacteraceae bacterium]|nr:hypothetical protein [Solirubrobacteraceae bacterium]